MSRMSRVGFPLLASATALVAWALVAVGGVVRVTESGLGCPDWPLCHGGLPPDRKQPLIESSHRVVAALVTLLVVAAAVWAWRRYRPRSDIFWPAVAAAVLVPFQALLGAVVVWLELPSWIVGVHFVVGMLFLATTVATAARAWRPAAGLSVSPTFAWAAWAAVGGGLALVSLGASVVSPHAEGACGPEWPGCNGGFAAGGPLAALQVSHRTAAYLVAAIALTLGALAWRGGAPRAAGLLPLLCVAGQIGIGIALVLAGSDSGAHHPLEIAHVAVAGLVWAALVAVAALAGRPQRLAESAPVRARSPAHAR
jgi:heme A synthase